MLPNRLPARVSLVVLGVTSAIHLVAKWLDAAAWADPTQWLLMPILAVVVLMETTRPRSKVLLGTCGALGFSWLGDSVPSATPDEHDFLVMVGFFLVAQLIYVSVFAPMLSRDHLRRNHLLAAAYAVAVGLLTVICAPGAAGLLVPVLVYGLLLATMAFCASAVHPWTAAGGGLFLLSDGLIALNAFVPDFPLPHTGFWVMLTYVSAQVLIVLGVLARERSVESAGDAGTAGSALRERSQ